MKETNGIDRYVLNFLRSESAGSDGIVIAISGGPDSMALLHSVSRAAEFVNRHGPRLSLLAAHCNFHLRGDESDRDEGFVSEECRKLGVELVVRHFDTLKVCRDRHVSVETAARDLRHEWFRELCAERNALLATGHNADDNAETLLLNLLRGSGTRGLKGMLPRRGNIISPLLAFHRSEITGYLDANGIGYVTDSTNLESDYRRNFLRNEVLPLLRDRWPGADRAIQQTLKHMASENAVVEQAVASALGDGPDHLEWETIRSFADPELLILRFIQPFGGTTLLAEEMAGMADAPRAGAVWELKCPGTAVSSGGGTGKTSCIGMYARASASGLDIIRRHSLEELSARFAFEQKASPFAEELEQICHLPKNRCALSGKQEDYFWSRPCAGMKMRCLGMKAEKPVGDIIRDSGLGGQQREDAIVLCRRADKKPVWIPGIRRSALNLVDSATSCWLMVSECV